MIYKIKKTDGSISIMRILNPSSTIEEELAKWSAGDRAKVVSYSEVDSVVIPDDRTFRNAWESINAHIAVSMLKAQDIKMNQLRTIRDEKLKALDIAMIRAVETGNQALIASIAASKQALRDLPQNETFAGITTPEELKSYIPPILR